MAVTTCLKRFLLRSEGLVVNSHVREGVDQVLVSLCRAEGPALSCKRDSRWLENT